MENQNGNNWERPTIQNNFYGNIGQQINHVDKIEAHFDKNMGHRGGWAGYPEGYGAGFFARRRLDWRDSALLHGRQGKCPGVCALGENAETCTDYELGQRMAGGEEDQ